MIVAERAALMTTTEPAKRQTTGTQHVIGVWISLLHPNSDVLHASRVFMRAVSG